MAITRAQQAKQMLQEGGMTKKIKGQEHMLAYITPGEADKLVELGGQETMTPEGIPAYRPSDYYGGTHSSKPSRTTTNTPPSGGGDNYNYKGPADLGVTTRTKDKISPPAPYTYIGGDKIDVIPENRDYREELERQQLVKRQKEIDDFINTPPKPINTPFPIVTTGLNAAQKFLPYKVTRNYYAQNVVGKTYKDEYGNTKTFGLDAESYDDYDQLRKSGKINAAGRQLTDFERGIGVERDPDPDPIIPIQDPMTTDQATEELIEEEEEPFELARRFRADGGIMNADIVGGFADGSMDEMGRQMYGLGKLVKKATRAVKKIAKSPIGKAALLYTGVGALGNLAAGSGLGGMFAGFTSPKTFLAGSKLGGIFSREGLKNILVGGEKFFGPTVKGDIRPFSGLLGTGGKLSFGKVATLTSFLPLLGLGTGDETEQEAAQILDNSGLDIDRLRNDMDYQNSVLARRFRANGGIMRLGYQEGGDAEPVAKKTMPLLDMDGMEKDYRETGGFVEMGRMERADDVPARLSKNEFVFTADAVRNAGDGDIDKGAEVMYNMMKNLENGGDVSEESQGLEGARQMFQTSQRLEEVL